MIRCGQRSIIFLINNGGYTIEVEIHDGPYNVIKNWDYTGLVNAIHNGEGKCWTAKVSIYKMCVCYILMEEMDNQICQMINWLRFLLSHAPTTLSCSSHHKYSRTYEELPKFCSLCIDRYWNYIYSMIAFYLQISKGLPYEWELRRWILHISCGL